MQARVWFAQKDTFRKRAVYLRVPYARQWGLPRSSSQYKPESVVLSLEKLVPSSSTSSPFARPTHLSPMSSVGTAMGGCIPSPA